MTRSKVVIGSGDVFADLNLAHAADLNAKAALMSQVVTLLRRRKLTQTEAAKVLRIDQPRVSALMNGKLSLFSTEKLIEFLTALGHDVDIVIKKRTTKRPGRVHVVDALVAA